MRSRSVGELEYGDGVLVSVLGPLLVAVNGQSVVLRRKEREVLCALVLFGGAPVDEESLIEALWNGSPPGSAANSLHVHVNRLRAALGPAAVVRADGGYRVSIDELEVDSSRFERVVLDERSTRDELDQVHRLWRGDPYAELATWPPAVAVGAHLVHLRCLLEDRMVEIDLAARGPRFVVPQLERLARAEPLRERRWVLLANALAADGRNVEALRTIQRARDALLDTAGMDPGPELIRLEQRLLVGQIEPTPAPQTVETAAVETAAVEVAPAASGRHPGLRRRQLVIAVVVLVVFGAAVWAFGRVRPDEAVGALSASPLTTPRPADGESSTANASPATSVENTVGTTVETDVAPTASAAPPTSVVEKLAPADSSDPDAVLESISCDDVSEIAFAPTAGQGPRTTYTRCTVLTVTERRGQPESADVRLLVVTEPGNPSPSALPVVSLGEFRDLARSTRGDHIVVAMRGLIGSDPTFDCPELRTAASVALGPAGPTVVGFSSAAQACEERLTLHGHDLAAYNSVGAADDIADLARLLAIDRFHVGAVGAFGSQVVQRLVERHPAMVASVMLQDPQPTGVAFIDVAPATLARTWRAYADSCETDPDCAKAYPGLDASLARLSASLQEAPLDIEVSSGGQDPPTAVHVDGRLLQLALLYAFDIPAAMPLIASFVTSQDADVVGRFVAGVVLQTSSGLAAGSGYRCTDEAAYRNLALADATQQLAGSFGLVRDWLEMTEHICDVWPHDEPAAIASASNVPTLIVRGLLSPYLASDWDVRLDRQWPSHLDLSLATVTFGTDDRTPACVGELIESWRTDPSTVEELDVDSCSAQSPPIPFAGAS